MSKPRERETRSPDSALRPIVLVGILTLLASLGCHPLSVFFPPAAEGQAITSTAAVPAQPVRVLYDERGVAHLWAHDDYDASYALGFVHARDRLTQIVVQRAFAYGRLTELAGDSVLWLDRENRLNTVWLDEEVANTQQRPASWGLLEAYAAGVNDGAAHAGPSSELFFAGLQRLGLDHLDLSGLEFEPYTPRDIIVWQRSLAQNLITGWTSELARLRIAQALRPLDGTRCAEHQACLEDPRVAALTAPVSSLGSPLVPASDDGAVPIPGWPPRSSLGTAPTRLPPGLGPDVDGLLAWLGGYDAWPYVGGSNAWAVGGDRTRSGHALLAHDPHVLHLAPSLFYLAHLEVERGATDDMGPATMAGATVPGLPGVLIGHGRHIAWGTPTSNADVKDLVRVEVTADGKGYILDGEVKPFGTIEQRYVIGDPADPDRVEKELWRTTVFGPVLPPAWKTGSLLLPRERRLPATVQTRALCTP